MFTGGDNLTAATGKLVAAVSGNADAQAAAARVENAVLLVRVANWRFLATMDPAGVAIFQTNTNKTVAELASLEKLLQQDPALQPALAQLPPVREALESYRIHFENASSALLDGARRFSDDMLPRLRAMQDAMAVPLASLKPRVPPIRSARRSSRSAKRPAMPSKPSGTSARPSARSPRSQSRSRPRSRNRRQPPRKSAAASRR